VTAVGQIVAAGNARRESPASPGPTAARIPGGAELVQARSAAGGPGTTEGRRRS